MKANDRIYKITFASVYPMYVTKAERKGRTKKEVHEIIMWLTGYTEKKMQSQIKKQVTFDTFFKESPLLNPSRKLIKGVICGVRIEDIKEPLMREIRYLDKLVDELAKGRAMEKILRKEEREIKDGDKCKVIAGTHKGKSGIVRDINTSKTGTVTITVVQKNGIKFKTLAKNVDVAK